MNARTLDFRKKSVYNEDGQQQQLCVYKEKEDP